MQFPNAQKGVSQIYKAEILALIAGILAVIAAVLAIGAVAANEAEAGGEVVGGALIGAGGLALVMGVLAIISFILMILGTKNAAKDEGDFSRALIWLLLGIVGSIVVSAFSSSAVASTIGTVIKDIGSLLSTIYVITGVLHLAERLQNPEEVTRGNKLIRMMLCIYVIVIVLEVIKLVAGNSDSGTVIAGVLAVVAAILMLVAYFIYLKFLSRARRMLEA